MIALRRWICLVALLLTASPLLAQGWRAATMPELEQVLPSRAPVVKERIETEMRTASGIIDARGQVIAAVVLITAGYSAEGKYSHYLLVQHAIQIDEVTLGPGRYVFGWNRVATGLELHLYDASTGAEEGSALAHPMKPGMRVETFRIWPPNERSVMQIGRFETPYRLLPGH
ncbi:hypothetical protein SAMN05421771_3669 [Granulicella pectinivorans]|uniref:Uncharacterized protein n=1 Tax=Granulicella pectinivorans TaxID=474950 RepID=A0A1I6MXT3_9BACT|nr:hypothetical protein [Granulicella pectinivorans]SFS20513.1 hypothetical protein SAMN05421771_3669 [Granulicella pectinivorans]